MTAPKLTTSFGIGPEGQRLDFRDVVRFIHSVLPTITTAELVRWVSRWEHLDLGEMDLSRWPIRPVSSTGPYRSLKLGSQRTSPDLKERVLGYRPTAPVVEVPTASLQSRNPPASVSKPPSASK
jgi:hypothetical protein